MSKRKRWLTRTETRRRQRISLSLKRFYRRERREREARRERAQHYERSIKWIRGRFDVSRKDAKGIRRRAREDATTLSEAKANIEAARKAPPPTPPPPVPPAPVAQWSGRVFAFNVGEVEPQIAGLFPHHVTVTALIEYETPQLDRPAARRTITFDSGAHAEWSGDDSFGRYYYSALRDDYKDYLGVSTLTSEQVAVYVLAFSP